MISLIIGLLEKGYGLRKDGSYRLNVITLLFNFVNLLAEVDLLRKTPKTFESNQLNLCSRLNILSTD